MQSESSGALIMKIVFDSPYPLFKKMIVNNKLT